MSEKNIDCAIAHFDKKVTDYQLHVDRELINQDKKINTQEKYLINTLDSHKKLITDFIEENANAGSDAPTTAKFTLITESGEITCDNENGIPGEYLADNLNLTKCLIIMDFSADGMPASYQVQINGNYFYIYPNQSGQIITIHCDTEDGILRFKYATCAGNNDPEVNYNNLSDVTGDGGIVTFADKINNFRCDSVYGPSYRVKIYGR